MPLSDQGPATVAAIALSTPTLLPATATLGDVRRYLAGGHVHLALLVEADRTLVSCVSRADLASAGELSDGTPARRWGTTAGRTARADDSAAAVARRMARDGVRRLAVIDDRGRVVGLVCRKRSGTGFCTDAGVADRRAERGGDGQPGRTAPTTGGR